LSLREGEFAFKLFVSLCAREGRGKVIPSKIIIVGYIAVTRDSHGDRRWANNKHLLWGLSCWWCATYWFLRFGSWCKCYL